MLKWMIALVFLIAFLPIQARAQDEELSQDEIDRLQAHMDRFNLFNDCQPINLVVKDVDSETSTTGLTNERILTMIESRLRAARIYGSKKSSYLHVDVGASTQSVSGVFIYRVYISFRKLLYDPITDLRSTAITWISVRFGTHDGEVGLIDVSVMQSLSERIDRFVLEYLRENDCGR